MKNQLLISVVGGAYTYREGVQVVLLDPIPLSMLCYWPDKIVTAVVYARRSIR